MWVMAVRVANDTSQWDPNLQNGHIETPPPKYMAGKEDMKLAKVCMYVYTEVVSPYSQITLTIVRGVTFSSRCGRCPEGLATS